MKSTGDYQYSASGHKIWMNTIDSEMNVISAGDTQKSIAATNADYVDWLIMKHGPSGELIWQKQLGSTTLDHIASVAVDSNDNVYVFGHTTAANGGTFDGDTISKSGSFSSDDLWLLAKFDKDGNKQWLKQIDKTGSNGLMGDARGMDIEGSAIYAAGWSDPIMQNLVVKL